jgi:hypothetical protein
VHPADSTVCSPFRGLAGVVHMGDER